MKSLLLLLLCASVLASCTVGPMKTIRPDGSVEEGGWFSFGQLQTADGYNTIYVNKGVGGDMEIPVPGTGGFSVFKLSFGYLNSTRMLLAPDATIVLDVSIDMFNKGTGVTDTMLYGQEAVTGYAEFLEDSKDTDKEIVIVE